MDSTTGNLPRPQLAAASADRPTLKTTPIEQVRVGQRVLTKGENPDETLPTAIDQRTWRHLTLEETDTWPDGTVDRICVESLMPPDWLALHDGAPVGSRVPIPLDLEEMGLPEGMTARVTANEPCPAIDRGPGRVVLTTVNHLNPRVVELCLAAGDGTKEEVRPTALHKFYSETRGEWLSAEDLQPGEILRGLSGPLQVVSQRPVPGTHRVYNMTVEGEHVYHVSTLGVLAHNMMCAEAPTATQEPLRLTHQPTTHTLSQVRSMRQPAKWQAGEQYVQELYGSAGQRHFPVTATGGRYVDAPVDLPSGGVLAGEVKTYGQWRTVSGVPQRQTVPLSDHIRQQIQKDVWLRNNVPDYDPRWVFLDAPPSQELLDFLRQNRIVSVTHQ